METFINKLSSNIDKQLLIIELEEINQIDKAQKSIACIRVALCKLKSFVLSYTFKTEKEEIQFFKKIKPDIFSKLIYFVSIFNIESRRPLGSFDVQINYIQYELEKLTFFFNSHLEFYQYYRMNSSYLDDKYFIRGKEDIHLYQDSLMFYVDPDFSTSHDYMVAQIIANDRLEVYFNKELELLSIKDTTYSWSQQIGNINNNSLHQWTDSKTALIELIYALYSIGSINNGRCEIKELTAFFEQIFNVRLTDIYRTFLEIKGRSVPTKYIDNLKAALIRKMEEDY